MKLSLTLAGREFSLGAQKSILSPAAAAWIRAEDVDVGGEGAKMVSPYSQSAWVYIAITRLAEKISSLPFRISSLDETAARRVRTLRQSSRPEHRARVQRDLGENILESGAAVDLFNRPHPFMSRQLFWEMVVTWNCLRGEFFVMPLDAGDNPVDLATSAPQVRRMLTLPTELFWHIVTGYELTAWRYTGSPLLTPIPGEILLPSEVVHSRLPNPYLFWRGMSPLIVAMIAAGADFAAAKYNQGYWLNNADTGLIVSSEGWPTTEQRASVLAALRERKRKAGTPDRPMFLGGGVKVEKPTLSGMESNFIENRKMNRQEIGAIYKVSDAIMGFSTSTALSGGDARTAEELSFIENTIMPLCQHLEAAMEPIVKTFGDGLVGWFDIESLPVMQKSRQSRMDVGIKAFGLGYTRNEVNQVYDLGFPEDKSGDKRYLPFNLQELDAGGEMPAEDPRPADGPSSAAPTLASGLRKLRGLLQLGKPDPDIKCQISYLSIPDTTVLWNAHITTRRKTVNVFKGKVAKVLSQFRMKTLSKLNEIHLENSAPSQRRSLIDLIFNPNEYGKKLVAELTNPITLTLQLAGNELHRELGLDDPWTMPPKKAKEFIAQRTQPIMDSGVTVRDQINTALNAGLDEGESTKQLAERVRGAFNTLSEFEAKRVAQTEVNMAYNDARHDAMQGAGIEYKAWLSSHGPRVRPAHAQAELDYIDNPIPIDEPFRVGPDEMMFPGDDSLGAGPENIINCQCIQLAAEKTADNQTTMTFTIHGLGPRTFPNPQSSIGNPQS